MKVACQSVIALSTLSVASAFISGAISGGASTGVCVQQKLDLSSLGSAILYTCNDGQSRGAELGSTRIVNFEGHSPNGGEIVLAAGPIGYMANADSVQCAAGASVTVLQVRNDTGWVESGEVVEPTLVFDEQCTDTVDLAGRWIEAGSSYTDCGMDDFQCTWVVVPDEFYGSTGPYYTKSGDSFNCKVPDTYLPVCQASNLDRFNGIVQVRGDGLSIGVDEAPPSLSWYNNIATAQENRWVCSIPPGGAIEVNQTSTPLSVSGSTREAQTEAATLYVCEGADDCSFEFTAPPPSDDTTLAESLPDIVSTRPEAVESSDIGDAKSLCEQLGVLTMTDGPSGETNGTVYVLQGIAGKTAHAFCSDGSSTAIPAMPGNPDWLPGNLTEEEEYVALSGSRECQVPHLVLPPNFHPALTCEDGFNLVASVDSGLNTSFFHASSGIYLYGDNATTVSDKLNGLSSLSNVVCRERPKLSGAAGIGSWSQLKMIGTASVLLMSVLAW